MYDFINGLELLTVAPLSRLQVFVILLSLRVRCSAIMFSIYRKELSSFFTSLTGYLASAVFLVVVGLMMWVFPSQWNVLSVGVASLSTLFTLAPWVFLFLVPAVTMRMYSDELREGTLSLLLSRPLSLWAIVLGKFFAAVTLCALILLPTVVYMISLSWLSLTPDSIDRGATATSYIGLLLLAATYSAIGLFTSSLTPNALVAFLLAALIAVAMYVGLEGLASLPIFHGVELFVVNLGIAEHYQSIQRGVIDTRDIVYFLALISLALAAARARLAKLRA